MTVSALVKVTLLTRLSFTSPFMHAEKAIKPRVPRDEV